MFAPPKGGEERRAPLPLLVPKITARLRPTGGSGSRCRVPGQVGAAMAPIARNLICFWPIYTGQAIPIDSWRSRMWLDTWV